MTLTLDLPKERRWVAVVDPLPAGFEPVESWFETTAADLAKSQRAEDEGQALTWGADGGAVASITSSATTIASCSSRTRLGEGQHEFTYMVRATTAGTFKTAPTHVEEMYEPEVFGPVRRRPSSR